MAFYSQSAEYDSCKIFSNLVWEHIESGNIDEIQAEAQDLASHSIVGITHNADGLIKVLQVQKSKLTKKRGDPKRIATINNMITEIETVRDSSILEIARSKDSEHDMLAKLVHVANDYHDRSASDQQIKVRGKTYSTNSKEYIVMYIRDGCRAANEFNNIVAVRAFKKFITAMRRCQNTMENYVKEYSQIQIKNIMELLVERSFPLNFGNENMHAQIILQKIEQAVRPKIKKNLMEMLENMKRQAKEAVNWFLVIVNRAKETEIANDPVHGIHQDDIDAVGRFSDMAIAEITAKIEAEDAIVVTNLNTIGISYRHLRKTVMWHVTSQYEALARSINEVGAKIHFEILSENRYLPVEKLEREEDEAEEAED